MSKALFWTTFLTIFLAELGDKTQLATLAAAARGGTLWTVFFAASLALVCTTAIGVVLGGTLFKYLPVQALRYLTAAGFIGVGIWVLVKG